MNVTRKPSKHYRSRSIDTIPERCLVSNSDEPNNGIVKTTLNTVQWDDRKKKIEITIGQVSNLQYHPTIHDYHINLTLDDVSEIIATLAQAEKSGNSTLLRDHLCKQRTTLLKLLACANDFTLTPIPIEIPKV